MPDATAHYNLQKAGAATTQNKWALLDGNMDLIERGRTISAIAGEALAARDLVYISTSDGKFYKATNANRPLAGFILADAAISTQAYAQEEGLVVDDQQTPDWVWTPFQPLYAHPTTPGALTQVAPTRSVYWVALALTATQIWVYRGGLQARLVAEPMLTFPVPGDPLAAAPVSVRLITPITGAVRAVKHLVTQAAGTDYIYDLHKNGTTIYTTQANRPTRTAAQGTGLITATLPDVLTCTVDDIYELHLDQKGTGIGDFVLFLQLAGVGPA